MEWQHRRSAPGFASRSWSLLDLMCPSDPAGETIIRFSLPERLPIALRHLPDPLRFDRIKPGPEKRLIFGVNGAGMDLQQLAREALQLLPWQEEASPQSAQPMPGLTLSRHHGRNTF